MSCALDHYHNAKRKACSFAILLVVLLFLDATNNVSAFIIVGSSPALPTTKVSSQQQHHDQSRDALVRTTPENEEVYNKIHGKIKSIARELWNGEEIPCLSASATNTNTKETGLLLSCLLEGEAKLPDDVSFSDRAEYFRREALKGCPKSQHSYGLLLWSGFGVERNPEESAKFHAAAACQHHLDGMVVFGGCLRTGTGVGIAKKEKQQRKNNVALGLKLIDFCSSVAVGNPTGVNKKAALLESNDDDYKAMELYENCLTNGRPNALLLFNLGWCLVNGQGVDRKDSDRGIALMKEAAALAPDEGSEEAAWCLFKEYIRDDSNEAQRWLDLAEELGYYE